MASRVEKAGADCLLGATALLLEFAGVWVVRVYKASGEASSPADDGL